MEDEFENFDPQRYWAKMNNEYPATRPGLREKEKLEELILTTKHFRSMDELMVELRVSYSKLQRLFEVARYTRGITIDRTQKGNCPIFRLKDSRKKS